MRLHGLVHDEAAACSSGLPFAPLYGSPLRKPAVRCAFQPAPVRGDLLKRISARVASCARGCAGSDAVGREGARAAH
jgi:hypothetical protein